MMLRDFGLTVYAICGVATEIGIKSTVRYGADLGLVPIVLPAMPVAPVTPKLGRVRVRRGRLAALS
jgi:nicotinamidase-related amidase